MLRCQANTHPAERVEAVPLQVAVELQAQLLQHLLLRVGVVQVAQVHQRLAHRLVLLQRVRVAEHVAHDVAVLVGGDEHLLRLDHALDHEQPQALQHAVVQRHARVRPCSAVFTVWRRVARSSASRPGVLAIAEKRP